MARFKLREDAFPLSHQNGSLTRTSLILEIASFFQIHPLAQLQAPYQNRVGYSVFGHVRSDD